MKTALAVQQRVQAPHAGAASRRLSRSAPLTSRETLKTWDSPSVVVSPALPEAALRVHPDRQRSLGAVRSIGYAGRVGCDRATLLASAVPFFMNIFFRELVRRIGRGPSTAVLLLTPLLAACPSGKDERRAPKEQQPCRELFAQCALPDGPLGVCNEMPCEANQKAPCLRCVSQH